MLSIFLPWTSILSINFKFWNVFLILWTLFIAGFIWVAFLPKLLIFIISISMRKFFLFSFNGFTAKPSKVNIYFVESFLKSHGSQEIRASSTMYCQSHGILDNSKYLWCCNIYKNISQKTKAREQQLWHIPVLKQSCLRISWISQETIHDAAIFLNCF